MTSDPCPFILVVDDEPSICWGFEKLLTGEGQRVLTAGSAEAGLRLAAEHPIALVLLDVRLPGQSGLEALPKFLSVTGGAPVVVMTAFGDLETAVEAVRKGAVDYLTKPFRLDAAADVCRRALRWNRGAASATASAASATAEAGADRQAESGAGTIAASGQTSPRLWLPESAARVRDGNARDGGAAETLVGVSPAMQKVFRQIALVAASDLAVLISGETGTGKELVAVAIHRHSHRRDKPYVPVAVVSLSPALLESELFGHVRGAFTGANEDRKGYFEAADGGTLLLDEIGDLPLAAQVKLLRVLEQRQFSPVGSTTTRDCNVRLLAATHRDLRAAVSEGAFREDLLYRMTAVTIELPPLRQRTEDIPVLATHFLRRMGYPDPEGAIDEAVRRELCQRPWYGNVRELRNAVEHAAVIARGRPLDIRDFPAARASVRSVSTSSLDAAVEQWTRERLRHSELAADEEAKPGLHDDFLAACEPAIFRTVLEATSGNRAEAALRLGLHRATLRERLKRYGLE